MKIFCHIPRENWFCDRYGKEYKENSRYDVTFDNLDSDIIWLLAGWCWNQIPLDILSSKKVICTIHHEVPWKFDEARSRDFLSRDQFIDAYHVPCRYTGDFIKKVTKKPVHQISYWANKKLWVQKNRQRCKKQFNLEDSFVISSFQRDTEGGDLKSPKLEKGPDRFCDFVESKYAEMGNSLHVLLNGWRRQYVISRLESSGIPYSYYELPKIEDVVKMYNATDLYVVGSRVEGGPQSIIECALTRTPIISTDVGIARDILPDSCIIDMDQEYFSYIPSEEDIEYSFNRVQKITIENHIKRYDDLFKSILEE